MTVADWLLELESEGKAPENFVRDTMDAFYNHDAWQWHGARPYNDSIVAVVRKYEEKVSGGSAVKPAHMADTSGGSPEFHFTADDTEYTAQASFYTPDPVESEAIFRGNVEYFPYSYGLMSGLWVKDEGRPEGLMKQLTRANRETVERYATEYIEPYNLDDGDFLGKIAAITVEPDYDEGEWRKTPDAIARIVGEVDSTHSELIELLDSRS